MQSKAATVKEYLASLPEDRRKAMEVVRKVITQNVEEGIEEGMLYGMPAWYVPHSIFPDGYHCDPKLPLGFVAMASQKQYMSLYVPFFVPGTGLEQFLEEWKKTGKKLDMGKSCIRFKSVEEIPLEVVGRALKRLTVKKYIAAYLAERPEPKKKSAAKKAVTKAAVKKPAGKKRASKAK